jgi:exonuclease III
MKIGTWNVRSLFWPGSLNVLHNERSKLDCDIVALQETRLENSKKKFYNFALFNSGLESKKHEFGCGFFCKWKIFKICLKFPNYKCLRLKAKWFSFTSINVHAPTNKTRKR